MDFAPADNTPPDCPAGGMGGASGCTCLPEVVIERGLGYFFMDYMPVPLNLGSQVVTHGFVGIRGQAAQQVFYLYRITQMILNFGPGGAKDPVPTAHRIMDVIKCSSHILKSAHSLVLQ